MPKLFGRNFTHRQLLNSSGSGDAGPAFYELEDFKWGRGWFGGLVTSCGLAFVGHPEVDPEEENAEMPLHGHLSYIPAKNVGIEEGWEGADYVVRIRGQMREFERKVKRGLAKLRLAGTAVE